MINMDELRLAIRNMTRQQQIFFVLRDELKKKGYWRVLPRGNPSAGFRKGWGKNKR